MLRREDFSSGAGCTELQREYYGDWKRLEPIRQNQTRRNLLQLAVLPKPVDRSNPQEKRRRFVTGHFDPDHLIVDHRSVDVYIMRDRPVSDGRTTHRVETLILGETAYLDRKGFPRVGGSEYSNHAVYDFAEPPFLPFQDQAVRRRDQGPLLAPRSGTLRYRRIGNHFDVCIDEVSYSDTPLIIFRFTLDQINDTVKLTRFDRMPDNGEALTMGSVRRGDEVAVLEAFAAGELFGTSVGQVPVSVPYIRAKLNGSGQPAITTTLRKVVPAHREREFKLFVAMNRQMLQYTRFDSSKKPPALPDPAKWAWSVLFEFDDARQLLGSPEYVPTPTLQRDLLAALSVTGLRTQNGKRWYLRIRSNSDGRIESIQPNRDGLDQAIIRFSDGCEQVVPYYATKSGCNLRLDDEDSRLLTPGQTVRRGQSLGDLCPRVSYKDYNMLNAVLGDNSSLALEEFLNARSVTPGTGGWEGPGLLIDSRYCAPQGVEVANRTSQGGPTWYWDLRASTRYLCGEGEHILCPPIRFNGWQQMYHMNEIPFFLGEPHEMKRFNRRAQVRRKAKRRSSKSPKQKPRQRQTS